MSQRYSKETKRKKQEEGSGEEQPLQGAVENEKEQKRSLKDIVRSNYVENNALNIWHHQTWSKRPTEPVEAYSVFTYFLHSSYNWSKKWVKDLSMQEVREFPEGYRNCEDLKKLAKRWHWDLRKNDYINQIYEFARAQEGKQLESTGQMLADIGRDFAQLARDSMKKKAERGDELDMQDIIAYLKLATDLQMHIENLNEKKNQRIAVQNMSTDDIKQLTDYLDKLDK